jgi:hypothetical protein
LVLDAQEVAGAQLPFVFTDGHAVIGYTRFFTDLEAITNVDFEVMRARYWNDTSEDGDRKRRRQAEFLVHTYVPWELIREIGVLDSQMRDRVNLLLRGETHVPPVRIRAGWYY